MHIAQMDDAVGPGGAEAQAVEILEVPAQHLGAGGGQRDGEASDRARPTTSCPAPRSSGPMAEPMKPDPPVTKRRIAKPRGRPRSRARTAGRGSCDVTRCRHCTSNVSPCHQVVWAPWAGGNQTHRLAAKAAMELFVERGSTRPRWRRSQAGQAHRAPFLPALRRQAPGALRRCGHAAGPLRGGGGGHGGRPVAGRRGHRRVVAGGTLIEDAPSSPGSASEIIPADAELQERGGRVARCRPALAGALRRGGITRPRRQPRRPRWRSPSSGWRSSTGSPTRSGSTCPGSSASRSTSSVR